MAFHFKQVQGSVLTKRICHRHLNVDSTFDLFDGYYDGKNGLRTHFAYRCNVCYGDGVDRCKQALTHC